MVLRKQLQPHFLFNTLQAATMLIYVDPQGAADRALRAFGANAIDYLLKPFGKPRFERALARARERIATNFDGAMAERLLRAIESAAGKEDYRERLPVVEKGRIHFVNVEDIHWIEAAGNYARLHLAGRSREIRETLTSLETQLNLKDFVRIHGRRL